MPNAETNPNAEIRNAPRTRLARSTRIHVSRFTHHASRITHHNRVGASLTLAFTLIEVLLAVTVFAIVLAAINTVFFSAMRLRTRTSAALDEAAPIEQTLSIIRRDLQGALGPGGVLAGDFKSGSVSSSMGDQNSAIEFYTATGVIRDDSTWGDVRKVSYQLRQPMTRNPLANTAEVDEQWLMSGVEALDFICYDGANWRNSWDTSQGDTTLPAAIKVRLQLAATGSGDARSRNPIEMIVPLLAQPPASQTQTNEDVTQ
jgi:type II secretion system protein J